MEALVALYLAGIGTGWAIFDKKVTHTHLTCPILQKPKVPEGLVIEDCLTGCDKDFVVKVTKQQRGEIDRFANDCISFQETTYKFIDTYNGTIETESNKLEVENAGK